MSDLSTVVQRVIFHIERQRYRVRLAAVEWVLAKVAVAPLPNSPAIVLGVINLHGGILPVLDLGGRFGLSTQDYGVNSHLPLARTERRRPGLPVDEVREVAEGEVAAPQAVGPGIRHVFGLAALQARILFIHDLESFLALEESRELGKALEEMG